MPEECSGEHFFVYTVGDPDVVHSFEIDSADVKYSHYCCSVGDLTDDEAHELNQEMNVFARNRRFIPNNCPPELGEFGYDYFQTSGVYVYREPSLDSMCVTALQKSQREYDQHKKYPEDHPYFLLEYAISYADNIRRQKKRGRNQKQKHETKFDRVMGTMAHVLMKLGGLNEQEAIQRIRETERLKPELRERNIVPLTEVENYCDLNEFTEQKSFCPTKEDSDQLDSKNKKRSGSGILLTAGVVTVQQYNLEGQIPSGATKAERLKKLFGDYAYKHAHELRKELGLSD